MILSSVSSETNYWQTVQFFMTLNVIIVKKLLLIIKYISIIINYIHSFYFIFSADDIKDIILQSK